MTTKRFTPFALAGAAALLGAHVAAAEMAVAVERAPEAPVAVDDGAGAAPADRTEAAAQADADELAFDNGDRLHGVLAAIAGDPQELTWHREDLAGPMRLKTGGIEAVDLGPRPRGAGADTQARVLLTNGDELVGEILGMDGDVLRLRTRYAGELAVKRSMLRSFNPNSDVAIRIYRGPSAADEWLFPIDGNGPTWRFDDGVYRSVGTGALGRNFENLPDEVRIDFDLTWTRYARLNIGVFASRTDRVDGDAYMFSFNGSSIALTRQSPRHGSQNLGNVQVADLQSRPRKQAKITLLASTKSKQFAVMMDDRIVHEWKDTGAFDGEGKGIVFQPHSSGYSVGVGRIEVSRWDGNIRSVVDEPVEASGQDTIHFANNDKITGKVLVLEGEEVRFKTSYASLSVPVARVSHIVLSQEKAERARRNKGDIHAYLAGGGRLTFQLAELRDGKLSGSSENFGNISAELAAFRRIEFNIYKR